VSKLAEIQEKLLENQSLLLRVKATLLHPYVGGYSAQPFDPTTYILEPPRSTELKALWRWWARVILSTVYGGTKDYSWLDEKVAEILGSRGEKESKFIVRINNIIDYAKLREHFVKIYEEKNKMCKSILEDLNNIFNDFANMKNVKCRAVSVNLTSFKSIQVRFKGRINDLNNAFREENIRLKIKNDKLNITPDKIDEIKNLVQKIKNYLKLKETELGEVKIRAKNGEVLYDSQLKIGPDLLKLLGYIISEGTVSKNCLIITNKDQEVIEDICLALKNLKIPFYRIKGGVACASRIFLEILKSLGIRGKSEKRRVPKFIFSLGKKEISYFLSAYFEGDGGVEERRFSVVASSKSKGLISEIAYLLYYFGIIGKIGKTRKKPKNFKWERKKTYYRLVISGQDNLRKFAENINFISKRKREKLSLIIQKEGNTNVDIVPEVSHVLREIYHQLFKCQLRGIQDLSNLARKHYRSSPKKLKEIIKIIEERIKRFEDLGATYKILSELPELSTIIELGKNDRNLNKILWQTLGQSWRVVKNEGVKPFSKNAFKIIEIVTGKAFSLGEVKKAIYSGFKEMDLPIGSFSKTLQSALTARPESNTSFEIIQKAAHFVWQKYQDVLENKLPKVKEKLEQLKILANSDLFWDPIVEIKKIKNKKEKYVYDLTVDSGVFLAGSGGVFVHNSYFVKLEILRSLMQGIDVIVIDPENEYKMLADAVGGSFINISLASPNHINPFDLPTPREDERPEDVLRSNVINLVGLMRIMLGGLTPEEDAIMDRALTEVYAAKDITPETDPKLWKERVPIMEDLEKVLEGMEGAESLVRRLRKFTKGTFAQFFNQRTNISLDKPLVVFGIRDMEDELRPIASFIIMRYIWNKVRSELKKRILVIDEAWWIMKEEDGASFLYGVCKRGRKYWLGVTTITQDVGDFMRSMYGQPIITNSSIAILFKQSPATIDLVQKTFNLTDEEKYLLLETEVGEGIFFAGQKHVLMKVIASYTEDQIVTSSPEQILKIKMAKGIK